MDERDEMRQDIAALKAENKRLRAALQTLSENFHPGCRAEFEIQPVQYFHDLIERVLGQQAPQ